MSSASTAVEVLAAARAQVVEHDDVDRVGRAAEVGGEVGADEAGATGDRHSHGRASLATQSARGRCGQLMRPMGLLVGGAVLVALAALATARPDLADRTPSAGRARSAAALAGGGLRRSVTRRRRAGNRSTCSSAVGVGGGRRAVDRPGGGRVDGVPRRRRRGSPCSSADAGGWEVVGGVGIALATVIVIDHGSAAGPPGRWRRPAAWRRSPTCRGPWSPAPPGWRRRSCCSRSSSRG